MINKKHILVFFCTLLGLVCVSQTNSLNLLPDTTNICSGDSVLLKFPESQLSKSASFQWKTPKTLIYFTKQLYVKNEGKYLVKIKDGKKNITDSTFVKLNNKPKFNIRDSILCWGNTLNIDLKNTTYKYNWSTGEILNSIKIDKPNTYWVKISNKNCFYIDTFKVSISTGVTPNFGKEVIICDNEPNKTLSVKTAPDTKLYWNNGANTSSILIQKEGLYWVKSISKNCGVKTDSVIVRYKTCDCEIYIPNGFTPNDDGKNDLFNPIFQCEYSYFLVTISDRWGNTVYLSNNINAKWDGTFKGNPCPDDVYIYHLEVTQKGTEKKTIKNGHLSLFR